MVPSASAISAAAVTAMPDSSYNTGTATMRCRFVADASPDDPYRAFVTDASRQLVYAVEVNRHLVLGT